MKRLISLVLCFIMLAITLCSCEEKYADDLTLNNSNVYVVKKDDYDVSKTVIIDIKSIFDVKSIDLVIYTSSSLSSNIEELKSIEIFALRLSVISKAEFLVDEEKFSGLWDRGNIYRIYFEGEEIIIADIEGIIYIKTKYHDYVSVESFEKTGLER